MSHLYHPLIWWHDRRLNFNTFEKEWDQLEKDYPEVTFHYYEDESFEVSNLIARSEYVSILRPWLLMHHFNDYPELEQKAIFYIDSDIVFTKKFDFSPFLNDDICYLSNTKSYIAASYFDSKVKDVKEDMLEEYGKIDVLQQLTSALGTSRAVAMVNEDNSGGAQYLLKGINVKFWQKVLSGCLIILRQLGEVNQKYFPGKTALDRENKGFQKWCADMWSVLWNLWVFGKETRCPRELDFAWATDMAEKWNDVSIYHDAGASTRPVEEGHVLFYKRDKKYIDNGVVPFSENLSHVSRKYCSGRYVDEIMEAKPSL